MCNLTQHTSRVKRMIKQIRFCSFSFWQIWKTVELARDFRGSFWDVSPLIPHWADFLLSLIFLSSMLNLYARLDYFPFVMELRTFKSISQHSVVAPLILLIDCQNLLIMCSIENTLKLLFHITDFQDRSVKVRSLLSPLIIIDGNTSSVLHLTLSCSSKIHMLLFNEQPDHWSIDRLRFAHTCLGYLTSS